MSGLHKKILATLEDAGSRGMTLDYLKKRLHPIVPAAVAGAARRLTNQGTIAEVSPGRFCLPGPDAPVGPPKGPGLLPKGKVPKEDRRAGRASGRGAAKKKATRKSASAAAAETPAAPKKSRGKRASRARDPEAPPREAAKPSRAAKATRPKRGDPSPKDASPASRRASGDPTYPGRISVHRDGFGFVTPEDPKITVDIFVPPGQLGGAFPGDRVAVALETQPDRADGRLKGQVVEVLERARDHVTGFLEEVGPKSYVVMPTDPSMGEPVPIRGSKVAGAKPGDVVLAKLIEPKSEGEPMRGRVVERLGEEGDPALDVALLIHEHGIREEWTPAVLAAAAEVPETIDEGDIHKRLDLRDQPCFTIDGKDARDLDDAIYIEPRPKGGFRLWVHIADVSHYVRPGDVIDQEAVKRGTSTYFPDRVVPMLPVTLSNGICSLNPEVDRFALSARIDFDAAAKRVGFELFSTVIRSHYRLNYTDVHAACVELDRETRARLRPVLPDLERAFFLSDLMKKRRHEAGYLAFDLPAVKVKVNELGEPVDIVPVPDNKAYGLIEQFMVAANEAVSAWMVAGKRDFVFRNHETPDPQKLAQLAETARQMGVRPGRLAVKNPAPALQKFLEAVDGNTYEDMLRIMLLRCMKLAEYSPDNKGHFGLGSPAYTHFTSPIRRYPDLLVHRLLKDRAKILPLGKKGRAELIGELAALCKECSRLERVAEAAEREAIRLKKLHYLDERVGETFDGRVNGVAHFGLFVELDGVLAEGLIHVSQLGNEYFHYDDEKKQMVGNETGRVYAAGTRVRVRVEKVDLRQRKAMLVPEGAPVSPPDSPGSKERRGRRGGAQKPAAADRDGGGRSGRPRRTPRKKSAKKSAKSSKRRRK